MEPACRRIKVIGASRCVNRRVTWTAQAPGFIKGSFTLKRPSRRSKMPHANPMTAADSILALSRDARLLPFATSGVGAWLWAPDATHVIWANARGAAVHGAATPAALTERRFDPEEPIAQDIARLAASLPPTGAARLERVRGTGSNLVATCSRLSLPHDTFGILVIGAEPARPS